jgi:vanillin dehydrogenase
VINAIPAGIRAQERVVWWLASRPEPQSTIVPKGATPDMRVFYEESFGPVTAIKDHNDIADSTSHGPSSGVITNDMQKALDFKLEGGMVHINDSTVADEARVAFGAVRNSGFGREGARFSMEEMTAVKWVTLQCGQRWFPI